MLRGGFSLLVGAAVALARSYQVDGVVVALDPVSRTMLVSHRPIANYMPAMAMPFRVADPHDLDGLHPGARVAFTLEVRKQQSLARHVRRTPGADIEIGPSQERLRIGD